MLTEQALLGGVEVVDQREEYILRIRLQDLVGETREDKSFKVDTRILLYHLWRGYNICNPASVDQLCCCTLQNVRVELLSQQSLMQNFFHCLVERRPGG